MAAISAGSVIYDLVMDHTKFTEGAITGAREMSELKKVTLDSGTAIDRLAFDFEKLTRLSRDVNKGLQISAIRFGQLANQSDRAEAKARAHIATMRHEARILRERAAFGDVLTAHERGRIRMLERSANAFERQIPLQREFVMQQKRMGAEMRKTTAAGRSQATAMGAMQKQLLALARQIGFITLMYRAWSAAQSSVAMALDLQRSQLQFEIFTGSAGQAKSIISDLRDLAAATPLTLDSSQQATRTLLQYGVAGNEVIDVLKRIGDVAGGDHERLQRLALAMGQVNANGRLMGQELRQLTESGFNPLQVIAEETGVSMLDLRDQMADGAISAEQVRGALESATSAGGRFADQLRRVAEETPVGQIQRFKGEIEKLGADLGDAATGPLAFMAEQTRKLVESLRQYARLSNAIRQQSTSGKVFGVAETHSLLALNPAMGTFNVLLRRAMGMQEKTLKDQLKPVSPDAAGDVAKVNEEVDKIIQSLRKEAEAARLTRNELELLNAKRAGADPKEMARIRRLQAERDHFDREKERRKEDERNRERMQKEAERWKDRVDQTRKLRRQIAEIDNMERMGMLTERDAHRARMMAQKEFMDKWLKDAGRRNAERNRELGQALDAAKAELEKRRRTLASIRRQLAEGPGGGFEVGSAQAAEFMAKLQNTERIDKLWKEKPTIGEKELLDEAKRQWVEQKKANAKREEQLDKLEATLREKAVKRIR